MPVVVKQKQTRNSTKIHKKYFFVQESSMPQSGDYSVCGCVSAAAPLSAASQLMADAGCKQQTNPDYDIPSQSGKNDDIQKNDVCKKTNNFILTTGKKYIKSGREWT